MKNRLILEYFTGDPDTVYEKSDKTGRKKKVYQFMDSDCISFGFFQNTLEDGKQFFAERNKSHHAIARECVMDVMGKAYYSNDYDDFFKAQIGNIIYNTSAFTGRIFLKPKVITTWFQFSPETLKKVLDLIGGSEKFMDYIYVYQRDNQAVVSEYIEYGEGGRKTDPMMNKFLSQNLPSDLLDKIKNINNAGQSALAKKTAKLGNMTIAQYNSLIHQENKKGKKVLKEYFIGDPDTVDEFDDETEEYMKSYRYNSSSCISFGFFQKALGGKKEFVFSDEKGHHDISKDCAEEFVGRARPYMTSDEMSYITNAIYRTAAYKGRIFLEPKMVTFWRRISPDKMQQILDMIGGVERYKDFSYIIPYDYGYDTFNPDKKSRVIPLLDFLAGKHPEVSDNDYTNEEHMEDMAEYGLPSDLVDEIKKRNEPGSWAANKEREGWKTIAQRNNTIYQENKNNMKNNKYQKEFSNYLQIMNEALIKNDFTVYDAAKDMLEETVEDCKKEKSLLKEMDTTNFGILNHIFEEALPTLFKTNKKAVRNVIKTIKEDKNLMAEFNFYNIIRNYNSKNSSIITPETVLVKLDEQVLSKVDYANVKKSNDKLRKVMIESGVVPFSHVDDEKRKLYESGNVILSKKPTLSNLYDLHESRTGIVNYMTAHKDDKVVEALSTDQIIENFENKLKDTLTESEISFVQQITDFRTPIAEKRKEKLFNKLKEDCQSVINSMLKEDSDNIELKGLNDKLNEMKFNNESIVSDIAKLLEIRDILMDD